MKQQIKQIPGGDGWWKESSEDTFNKVAQDLVSHGFSPEQAIEILSDLYWATASCYGD